MLNELTTQNHDNTNWTSMWSWRFCVKGIPLVLLSWMQYTGIVVYLVKKIGKIFKDTVAMAVVQCIQLWHNNAAQDDGLPVELVPVKAREYMF